MIFLQIAMKSCFKNEEFQHEAGIKCQFFQKTPGSMTHLSSLANTHTQHHPRNPPPGTVVTSPCCSTSSAASGARSLNAKLTRPVARPKARRCGTAGYLPCVRNSKVLPASVGSKKGQVIPADRFGNITNVEMTPPKKNKEKRWEKGD